MTEPQPKPRDAAKKAPPFPTVLLGRGRWMQVIRALNDTGRKADKKLAEQIERQVWE